MKAKKTIRIDWLKNHVNQMLKNSTCSDDIRKGFCAVLECALHQANAYKGYNHLDWINGGYEQWCKDNKPDFPEKNKYLGNTTRRVYY